LGKLLVLPANVRLDWKVIARYKHSSLFGLIFCNKEKCFYNIDTRSAYRSFPKWVYLAKLVKRTPPRDLQSKICSSA